MQHCILIILFTLSMIFEVCSVVIPYSCNALRLNADIVSGIGLSIRYKDFLQDLADLGIKYN